MYGLLKEQLTRKLSNLLVTPLEPYQLFLTPTGERGMPVLLDFDGENLNNLVTASITTQLSVVLSIQNYAGRTRTLSDQFRPKTPTASAVTRRSKPQEGYYPAGEQSGTSVAHYDESGVLASRTCAVCTKLIPIKPRRKRTQLSLLCSRDGCGQVYHLQCSRWAKLSEEAMAGITAEKSDARFYCDLCVLMKPLCYWDFLADHPQHELLLTRNQFKSIGITRVPLSPTATLIAEHTLTHSETTETEASQNQSAKSATDGNAGHFDEENRSPWPTVTLLDRYSNLVGVGDKSFRIPATSRDPEMYIVVVRYVTIRAYPATRQERAIPKKGEGSTNNSEYKWEVSYGRQRELDIVFAPGSAVFWPTSFTRDVHALEYTRRSLDELESIFLYEFQGEQPHDKTFSVGNYSLNQSTTTTTVPAPLAAENTNGVWMNLTPRKGICMKLLSTQIGHLKKLQEVQHLQTKKSDKPKGGRKIRKPHFPRQQLNKIAVDTT